MTGLPSEADVVVVGSGPAGLSAATELRRLGVGSVIVLEREAEAGGVPRHCGHSPYGLREFRRPMFGPAYARRLADAARRAGVDLRTGATVTAIAEGPVLTVTTDEGVGQIATRAVLLATGTRETSRAGRLIGGQKPGGVAVTGALQGMVYGAGKRPFRAPVILGTELVAFSALLTCRHAGIRPVAMVEPGPRITARHPAHLLPRVLGVPLYLNTGLAEIEGGAQVSGVVLSSPRGPVRLEADGVVITGRFRPEAALSRAAGLIIDPDTGGPEVDEGGRTSRPGLYAAGNLLRPVETGGWCWEEGRRIARVIAADLASGHMPKPEEAARVRVSGALRYAVPQRISGAPLPGRDAGLAQLQLRVRAAAAGRLSLRVDGHEIAGRPLSALPERRLLLPLPPRRGALEAVLDTNA